MMKKILSLKSVIIVMALVGTIIGGIVVTKHFMKTNKNENLQNVIKQEENNNIEENKDILKNAIDKEENNEIENKEIENQKNNYSVPNQNQTQTQNQTKPKNPTTTNPVSGSNENKNNTEIEKKEEVKLSTKQEIEDYIRKNMLSDFRYDFNSSSECESEGKKWLEYGWIYNCTFAPVPNINVVPTMLELSTGKLFCDGKYTKSEKYDYKKAKITPLEYLRTIGYPCENIKDN